MTDYLLWDSLVGDIIDLLAIKQHMQLSFMLDDQVSALISK